MESEVNNVDNQETYNTNGNGYQYYYEQPEPKKEGSGFGIASLVLGIVSLLLFCTCLNWITGILAIIFGIIQIVNYRERGLAIGGIVTAALSLVFGIVFWIFMFYSGAGTQYENYYDYYFGNQYDGNYDGGSDSDGAGGYDGNGGNDGGNGGYDGGNGGYDGYGIGGGQEGDVPFYIDEDKSGPGFLVHLR